MSTVQAPWSEEQVAGLLDWQRCPWVHPFTCGNDCRVDGDASVLVPSKDGWDCEVCHDWKQDWCLDFMLNGRPPQPEFMRRIKK